MKVETDINGTTWAVGKSSRHRLSKAECALCGKEFWRMPCLLRRYSVNYCSRTCGNRVTAEGLKITRSGPGNAAWNGGRQRTNAGYVYVWKPDHPKATKKGCVLEHRLVMEQILGRYLLPFENVHHKNGIRDDNRPNNLELWVKSQPAGQRVADAVTWAEEILKLYKPLRIE